MTPAAHTQIRPSSDRTFGLVMSGFFSLVSLGQVLRGEPLQVWTTAVAAVFLVIALAYAPLLAPLNRLWTLLAAVLHRVMTPVTLGVLFFIVITPVALVMRACRRDALRLRLDPSAKSYWQERTPPGPDPASLAKQF